MKLTSLIDSLCNKDVKKIGFFGLGRSNTAIAELLASEGWRGEFTLRESSARTEAVFQFGISRSYYEVDAISDITEDILFLSPSLRRSEALLRAAEDTGCTLSSDAELFFFAKPKDVFAITGSDGKSTVTYLTSQLTKPTFDASPAGNYGLPLCNLIANDKLRGAVVELSSFQLSYVTPKVSRALITNVTENHLNWHKDFNEYISAKRNLFKNAECRAIALDTEVCRKIADDGGADILISDIHTSRELCSLYHPELTVTRELGCICVNGEPYMRDDVFLRSENYSIRNFMCALALSYGYTDKDLATELAHSFGGLEHRNECFHSHLGVRYINSSIDSTPSRTAVTLSALTSPAVVIIGGAAKGLSYAPLIRALRLCARAVVLTGESASTLFPLLQSDAELNGKVYREEDFDSAVTLAVGLAEVGDAVVLSPAHTSYDRFKSFEERGLRFKALIKEITK